MRLNKVILAEFFGEVRCSQSQKDPERLKKKKGLTFASLSALKSG